ncbi:TetR/AcrR family transcriptional regulator [Rhodococcus sp. P1Y]|uniref:TetR/AcrR family transcriptional regulator n=1 Tax=Rhodococcus sp. P1Y TaxID=1302308 RepID=UPI000EB4B0F4|nr:TetR/AcrR family transcriptional regulator [Rhodococcus sp. P1Y]AYJ48815.1 TetR/AcrR family transcriptional regulator [Rhodococcus sp. P1Y]
MTTGKKLVSAATALVDAGGEQAVTLRAVAAATGLSHNAPYKHFASRDALLAAVAAQDFRAFRGIFRDAQRAKQAPEGQLTAALEDIIAFSEQHPGRYRLLLSNPIVASQEGELRDAAGDAFRTFTEIIDSCQTVGVLPAAPNEILAGIVFATMHGLIDAQSSGRLQAGHGVNDVRTTLQLFLRLLQPREV